MRRGKVHTFLLLLLCTEVTSFTYNVPKPFSFKVIEPTTQTTTTQLHVAREKQTRNVTRRGGAVSSSSSPPPKRKEPYTEISRLKFMLNQLKGNMKESELRATAAERRVAMLQNQITQELKGKGKESNGAQEAAKKVTKSEQNFLNQIKALKGTIKSINAAMDAFKQESEKEIEDMKTSFGDDQKEWLEQMEKLQTDLDGAHTDLSTSRREADHLKKEIKSLENRMKVREMELTTEAKKNLEDVKKEAKEAQFTLEVEKELLKEKLMVSKKQSEDLLKDLEATKVEMTQEIIAIKTESQKKLEKTREEIEMKEESLKSKQEIITMLISERKSVRKLFKVQRYLIKNRIKKRLKRIFRINS